MFRNKWQVSAGMGGNFQPEQVAVFAGMGGSFAPEYAFGYYGFC